ncbi:MAG: AAA family ATPase [Chloroflexota bacterium]|nr:AAA family ATPase [Chloroflexota bacterium]MDE2895895.1 AAA family ATPase [Chloroflexota bacterium]
MRLRGVDLHGYKSFAARTALQFDAPVTAIVGPNGSGKSNVMDGLRWAIGAGSGRSLRTKRAEDVVFSGGRDRAPSGFAEVRVRLDNSDQWLPLDSAEVEIVRRVHRDGQSEIRVNGRTALLRDVQDMFRDSGLGSGGFALMTQGLVDEMLRLRPQERRQAIEEVGGVHQHRHQMEESRRRRQRAQEHLARAILLRDELSPRLKSLERLARRASRQADLQRQLGDAQRDYFRAAAAEIERQLLERHEASTSAANARADAERARESATDALAAVERETASARRLVESSAEKIRAARSELQSLEHQQELDQQQRSWLGREVEALRSQLDSGRERSPVADLEVAQQALADANRRLDVARGERMSSERDRARALARHERALAEIDAVRSQASAIARRWQANAVFVATASSDERTASEALERAETELQVTESELRITERQLAEAREASAVRSERLSRIERRLAEIEGQIAAAQRNEQHAETLQAVISSHVPDPAMAEALFGELIEAEMYEDLDQAIAAVERTIAADTGRGAALIRSQADELVQAALKHVEFVDDIRSAKRAVERGKTAVTRTGVVLRPGGLVQGGASRPGVIRLREHLSQLKSERIEQLSLLQELKQAADRSPQIEPLDEARLLAEARFQSQRDAVEQCRIAYDAIRHRQATAAAQRRSDEKQIATLRTRLQQARTDEDASVRLLRSSPNMDSVDIAALEQDRDRCAAELAEARAQSTAQERAREDRARLYSLTRELETVETAIRAREPELEVAQRTADDTATHQTATERLRELEARRDRAARDLEGAQQARLIAERGDVEAAAALRESKSARARLAAEAAGEGISIHHLGAASQPLMDFNGGNGAHAHTRNGSSLESRSGAATAVAVADPPASALKQAVDEIRGKLQRLGPVDPGAAQEYVAERERWQQMETQISDLETTESALRRAERDLEQLIERKFREACQQVDRAFRHYFQLMFRGGHAELVLIEDAPSDGGLSDTEGDERSQGVDIRAQPPGKRVSALGLLSGGERALTAIALLFALLEVRPAPFCVLDEVDAALDEANVERFVAALKERSHKTQFVIITHNRRTIEQADSIYGVTMGAAGVSRLLSVRLDQIPHTTA